MTLGDISVVVLAALFKSAIVHDVDPYVLMGVCHAESGLVANISNWDDPNGGSHGLCQVALLTARNLSKNPTIKPKDLYNPYVNAELAGKLLKENLQLNGGNTWRSVSMYNTGSPRRYNEQYVERVKKSTQRIKDLLCLKYLFLSIKPESLNKTRERTTILF